MPTFLLHRRAAPVALALLGLAACSDSPNGSGDGFTRNRVVARVEKSESGQKLRLDEPAMAIQLSSALDPARSLSLIMGGAISSEEEMDAPAPMLQLVIPGALEPRTYPVGTLDINAEEAPSLTNLEKALGVVVAPEPDGDDVDFFTTTGGTVQVVEAVAGTATRPGRLQARIDLGLREFYFDRFPGSYGKQASGTGTVDGPLMLAWVSDADLAFSGAQSGRTARDFGLGMPEEGSGHTWSFAVAPAAGSPGVEQEGWFILHLARIPAAGETLTLPALDPSQPGREPFSSTESGAVLQVYRYTPNDTLGFDGGTYISTRGQLRVEAANAETLRGTLTATLVELDPRTHTATGRTVTVSGRIGLALQAPGLPMGRNRLSAPGGARRSRSAPPRFFASQR